MSQVTFEMVKEASEALKDVAQRTPIVSAKKISPNVFFKAECLQKTGSFKLRGAYNKIRLLTDEEASRGVVACSAGNHAQGVALSATKRGIKSVVCMPESAGATGLAAFMFGKVDTSLKTVCIVSGGNVDLTTLGKIFEIGMLKREGYSVK